MVDFGKFNNIVGNIRAQAADFGTYYDPKAGGRLRLPAQAVKDAENIVTGWGELVLKRKRGDQIVEISVPAMACWVPTWKHFRNKGKGETMSITRMKDAALTPDEGKSMREFIRVQTASEGREDRYGTSSLLQVVAECLVEEYMREEAKKAKEMEDDQRRQRSQQLDERLKKQAADRLQAREQRQVETVADLASAFGWGDVVREKPKQVSAIVKKTKAGSANGVSPA